MSACDGPVTGSAATVDAGAAAVGPLGFGIAVTVDAVVTAAGAASEVCAFARLTVTVAFAVAFAVGDCDGAGAEVVV